MQASSWPLIPLWSVLALRGDGSARRGAADADGVALVVAHGGRSAGIQSWWDLVPDHVSLFLAWRSAADGLQKRLAGALARAKSRCAVPLMRKRAEWS